MGQGQAYKEPRDNGDGGCGDYKRISSQIADRVPTSCLTLRGLATAMDAQPYIISWTARLTATSRPDCP